MVSIKQWLVCMVVYCVMYGGSAQMEFSPTCGLPQPTPEQQEELDELDQTLIEDIRSRLQLDGPILMSDTDPMAIPLVTFTENQTDLITELYGDNPNSQFSDQVPSRRKREATSVQDQAACSGIRGFQPVLLALNDAGEIMQLNGITVSIDIGCTPSSNPPACLNCCLETICVPLVGFNIDTRRVGSANVMVNRCTCCGFPLQP